MVAGRKLEGRDVSGPAAQASLCIYANQGPEPVPGLSAYKDEVDCLRLQAQFSRPCAERPVSWPQAGLDVVCATQLYSMKSAKVCASSIHAQSAKGLTTKLNTATGL